MRIAQLYNRDDRIFSRTQRIESSKEMMQRSVFIYATVGGWQLNRVDNGSHKIRSERQRNRIRHSQRIGQHVPRILKR